MALQGKTKNVAMFMLSMAFTALFSTGAFAYNLSAKVKDVEITDNRQEIQLQMDATGDSSGTDGSVYIFEIKPYQTNLGSRTDFIAKGSLGENQKFNFPLYAGPGELRLYSAFVPAVKVGILRWSRRIKVLH